MRLGATYAQVWMGLWIFCAQLWTDAPRAPRGAPANRDSPVAIAPRSGAELPETPAWQAACTGRSHARPSIRPSLDPAVTPRRGQRRLWRHRGHARRRRRDRRGPAGWRGRSTALRRGHVLVRVGSRLPGLPRLRGHRLRPRRVRPLFLDEHVALGWAERRGHVCQWLSPCRGGAELRVLGRHRRRDVRIVSVGCPRRAVRAMSGGEGGGPGRSERRAARAKTRGNDRGRGHPSLG
jgi:hypothetical protein